MEISATISTMGKYDFNCSDPARRESKRLVERFLGWLKWNHPGITPDMLERASTPGYWRVKDKCPGGERCRHAFRGVMGPCDGDVELTISFSEHGQRDAKGRFVKPYRAWEAWRKLHG